MDRQSGQSEGLLSWVDLSRKDQARWIVSYLFRVQSQTKLAMYLVGQEDAAEIRYRQAISNGPGTLESVIQAKIIDDESHRLIESDVPSLKLIERMRLAWQQKKYREKSERQVSFQLPKGVADKVGKIARDKGQSRTYTLEQMVSDGVDAFEAGSVRSARRVAKLRHQLEKAHLDAQAAEVTLIQWSETLLRALAEEVVNRFHSDALDGERDEDAIVSFERMIERKVAELAPPAPLLRREGARMRPVKDYFIECFQKSLKNRW